jgi:hypothetical protein
MASNASLQQAPNVAATAAACQQNAACAMFTSDGFLIGIFRTADTTKAFNDAIERDQEAGGPLLWGPMQYCAGRCCGTWVADGLEQQLMTPVNDYSGVQEVQQQDIAADKSASEPYKFDADVMKQFCTQAKPSPVIRIPTAQPSQPDPNRPDQQQCPRRCQVACCAEFAKGVIRFESRNDFDQCAPDPCARGCTLPGNRTAAIGVKEGVLRGASSDINAVLKRQYLRAASVWGSNSSTSGRPSDAATSVPSGSLN